MPDLETDRGQRATGRGAALSKRKSKAIASAPNEEPTRQLPVVIPKDGDKHRALAHSALDPVIKSAAVSDMLLASMIGTTDLGGTVRALRECVAEVQQGNMAQADAMLVAQAYTMDSLFTNLIGRWQRNTGHNHQIAESYLRLAMKAQSQSRAAWESLSKIKNPVGGATFIRQANMANGPQQVNNHGQGSDVREIESQPNELMDALGGVRTDAMDSEATRTAGEGDTPLGTMEKRNRAED